MNKWLRARMGDRNFHIMKWIASVAVFSMLIITAVVSSGYQSQRLNLDDGSVWVSNAQEQAIGRANTKVQELNTVLTTESSDMVLLQNSTLVVVVNEATRSLDVVSEATGEVTEKIPLPQGVTSAALAAGFVVLHAPVTGEVWLIPIEALSSFDAQTQPANITVGPNSTVAVNNDGHLAAVSSESGTVSTMNITRDVTVTTEILGAEIQSEFAQITLVGSTWLVLDLDGQSAYSAGRMFDLSNYIAPTVDAVLQHPSEVGVDSQGVGSTDSVLITHAEGLISLNLNSGQITSLTESSRGKPASAVVVGTCAYTAWSSSSVWSVCGTQQPQTESAEAMSSAASLVFHESSGTIALNDTSTGQAWSVQSGVRLIDNWDALLAQEQAEEQIIQTNNADTPEYDKSPQPPVAVDDELGARPARVTALPVLLNDYDPNGDALVIDAVTPIPVALGEVFINPDRNLVMLRLAPDASGTTTFEYTITDGRGGEASATVVVSIRPESENSPPVQVRPTRADVVLGGQVIVNVLGDWVDPDGDAIFVASAAVDQPDSLSFSPAGRVAFTDSGRGGGGLRQISLDVSDGRAIGAGSVDITVRAAGQVPIVAEAFAVIALAGQPVTISPAAHVRGGSGPLSLSGVPAVAGVDIVPDFSQFSFTATTSRLGSTYLTYAVTDGDETTSGFVRLDVIAPPDVSAPPITSAHAVYVPLQQTRSVDVTATDRDPSGGVLVVTGVLDIPLDSGLQVEVVEHRLVRVTLTKPLDRPVSFGYRISNGVSQSQGTITVVQTPAPTQAQAPVAIADVVSVRVGDVITIPVLENDIHPDGGVLSLGSELDQNVPRSAGLLFASGSQLRFLAADTPGTYSAVYRVNADNGQWASGTVTISVRAIDEETNQPPTPSTITARAISGQTIRIPIPVVGIDPDGDSVQFVGLDTNPEKGSISEVGSDWIEYEASAYATGTDVFQYSVVDSLGAQGQASIRVGIAEALAGGRNPIAVADNVYARPGATVYVQALANDSDPDGRPLSLTGVTAQDPSVTADIVGDLVRITAPMTPGRYGVIYDIENDLAGSASNFITIDVQTQAPLSAPVIRDAVVNLTDILGQDSVDVNVLRTAFFADGPVSDLRAEIVSGFSQNARAVSANTIRVEVLRQSQIIPFSVSHPLDPSVTSTAFIWVPGTDDALPQRKRGAPALTVVSEEQLRISINDYVVAALGREVRITDSATVRATHADGSRLVVNDTTLSYTSEDRYFGPASLSFEVTDGTRTSTIVLPITVTPRENMPPVMLGANIDLEPGQEKTLDLVKVTRYPYVDDQDELDYTVTGSGNGVNATISGQELTVVASNDAVKGRSVVLTVTVKDQVNEGKPGEIIVRFVPSTKPLAIPATDSIIAKRGESQTVDVLANDAATNPFPNVPLRVISVRGVNSENIPAGVSVTPSADKSSLTVSVSSSAAPSDTTIEYEVADATNDPDRYVWGVVQISVQDVPSAPAAPTRASGFVSGSLTLSWPAPASNNSPITKYVVENDAGFRQECSSTVCTLEGLPTGQRSRFSVTAINAIGTSPPSPWSASLSADVVPAAPSNVSITPVGYDASRPEGGGLNVSWSAVGTPPGGSAVTKYVVQVIENGSTIRGSFEIPAGTTSVGPLWYTAGNSYVARVTAYNDADSDQWNTTSSASVVAAGPPTSVTIQNISNAANGSSTVTWSAAAAPSTGGQVKYVLATSSSSLSGPCPADYASRPSTTSLTATDSPKATGQYFIAVYAYNSYGCVAGYSQTDVVQVPGTANYDSASCVLDGGGSCLQNSSGAFVINVVSPRVSEYGTPGMIWQMKVGSQWVTMTELTTPAPSSPTFQITSSQYFEAGGTGGTSQTVSIRGCASEINCGAEGGTATITIPQRTPTP